MGEQRTEAARSGDYRNVRGGGRFGESGIQGSESRPAPLRQLQVDGVVDRYVVGACKCHNGIEVWLSVSDYGQLPQRAQTVG